VVSAVTIAAISMSLFVVTNAASTSLLAGSTSSAGGSTDGTGTNALLASPFGIAISLSRVIFVADKSNHVIRKITTNVVVTHYAGGLSGGASSGSSNGIGTNAGFNNPSGIAVDTNGNLYIMDNYNNLVRVADTSASVTTLAGGQGSLTSGYANGVGTNALFRNAFGIAIATNGKVFVGDSGNYAIRMISGSECFCIWLCMVLSVMIIGNDNCRYR
jgi:hypothetical protein